MAWRVRTDADLPEPPRRNVRVLRGEGELAEAAARAQEGARRLQDRLDARAAKDAWTLEHGDGAISLRTPPTLVSATTRLTSTPLASMPPI